MKITIDDTADITPELAAQYQIKSIPLNIHFGSEEFITGENGLSLPAFYEKAEHIDNSNWPKTSQPSPYQFEEFYRPIIAAGNTDILSITIGKKLSGTYASAMAAKKSLADEANIEVFSSESASAVSALMAVEAARLAEKGRTMDEILERLTLMREKQVIALTLNSLDWAVKGGRVSGARGLMASLLNIKPIMQVKDGEVVEAGKVRTHKKALRFMIDFVKEKVGDEPVKLSVVHANSAIEGERLAQMVKPEFNAVEFMVVDLCLPVAINLGPGTLGIITVPYFND